MVWSLKASHARYNFRFSLQDGLLHAIKEEYVEAVEILLEWEEKMHKPGQPYVNSISLFFPLSFDIFFILTSILSILSYL